MVIDLRQLSFSLMIWTWTENGIGFFFYFIYEKLIQSFYMYVNKNIIYLLFNCTLMVGWKAYYLEQGHVGQWCILVTWLQRFLLIFFCFSKLLIDRQTKRKDRNSLIWRCEDAPENTRMFLIGEANDNSTCTCCLSFHYFSSYFAKKALKTDGW